MRFNWTWPVIVAFDALPRALLEFNVQTRANYKLEQRRAPNVDIVTMHDDAGGYLDAGAGRQSFDLIEAAPPL